MQDPKRSKRLLNDHKLPLTVTNGHETVENVYNCNTYKRLHRTLRHAKVEIMVTGWSRDAHGREKKTLFSLYCSFTHLRGSHLY